MYLLLIFLSISIIATIIIRSTTKKKEFVSELIPIIVTIWVVFLFAAFTAYFIEYTGEKYSTLEYGDVQIQSAFTDKNFELNGAFILGIGSVHGGTSGDYIVYGEFDKGLKRLQLDPDYYFVREDNTKPPCIENYLVRKVNNIYKSKWTIFGRSKKSVNEWQQNYGRRGTSPIIVVPTNTIRKQYSFE